MATVKVGKLELDPSRSPAILDTTTWDRAAALAQVRSAGIALWDKVASAPGSSTLPTGECQIHAGSHASLRGDDIVLATLKDGQDVFLCFGKKRGGSILGVPIGSMDLADGLRLSVLPADMATLVRYLKMANPEKAPRAWGSVPRLGIGDRHTVAVWPAAFRAMEKGGFAANAIQNSLRELNLLEDLKKGLPARENYLFGFGRIAEGHTGSTFEGLLHAGVIAAVKAPSFPRYGADADHIQVKRGPQGLERAKSVAEAARHYTFFTLDVSDVLGYEAMKVAGEPEACGLLSRTLGDPALEKDVLSYHRRSRKVAGRCYSFSEADVGRFVGKYWNALGAVEVLYAHLKGLKGGEAFDVELSIDENPPEIPTAECITSIEEIVFLAVEMQRRHLPVTHIAPNFGVEKGTDYRCPDGLEGLEQRVGETARVAASCNLMLDCHSGDDLAKRTRQVFGRASRGRINFKLSPQIQIMFAETLFDVQPDLFRFWWDDLHAFVKNEAGRGSSFAQECLQELRSSPEPRPGAKLFHYYCFVSLGKRDGGRFLNRERLYDLSREFKDEYGRRLEAWLCEVADDLYGQV